MRRNNSKKTSRKEPVYERLMGRLMSDIAKMQARDRDGVEKLPKAEALMAFSSAWLPNIIASMQVLQRCMNNISPPRARLLTFEAKEGLQLKWSYSQAEHVGTDSTLDFADLESLMDEANAKCGPNSISVWVWPGAQIGHMTLIYIRMDEHNAYFHCYSPQKNSARKLPEFEICEADDVQSMGAIIYRNQFDNIAHWTALVDAFVAEFVVSAQDGVKKAFEAQGIDGSVSVELMEALADAIFVNERFVQLMMDAGRLQSFPLMYEDQSLLGHIEMINAAHEIQMQDLEERAEDERAKERKKMGRELDVIKTSLRGARDLAARQQEEIRGLNRKCADLQKGGTQSGHTPVDIGQGFLELFGTCIEATKE